MQGAGLAEYGGVEETDPTVGAAAEAMLADLGPLVEYVTAQVWHRIPGYRAVLMDSNELRSYISSNVLTVLSCVAADRSVNAAEYDRARHLGESRALQGVPLDALVQSFRTAERVLVDQFCLFHARVGYPADPGVSRRYRGSPGRGVPGDPAPHRAALRVRHG
jgi:hypothetical protein